ncbi:hypothetical protein RFI_37704 [Reticulomyxa filosa]|uniref:Uncharacterized protein n=1 Tax=Reticulomyxa filosa TaxID=46433 RepID=X6LDY1_RETFI|nr:hypothetical protein RFI_37704 [Reticulomyxa filosa]|eukprot:ETN99763.1 hypothetical protein RFI_37704 [Reticulomyxa filosa]
MYTHYNTCNEIGYFWKFLRVIVIMTVLKKKWNHNSDSISLSNIFTYMHIKLSDLGHYEHITMTKDDTTILNGSGKHQINDTLNATRAVVDQGVVIGGVIALLYSAKVLDNVESDNEDQRVCIDIVRKVVQLPAIAIIRNSGKEGSVFAGKFKIRFKIWLWV